MSPMAIQIRNGRREMERESARAAQLGETVPHPGLEEPCPTKK